MRSREEVLTLPVRNQIYNLVKSSPGLHFRELKRQTDLAIGSLQYHLDILEKFNFIKTKRKGKFVRYFPFAFEENVEEERLLALLRDNNIKKICLVLLTKRRVTNKRLAKLLELSPSTVSFHLKKLQEAELIRKKQMGRKTIFELTDKRKIKEILLGYEKSFLEGLVDNFVEIWEKL